MADDGSELSFAFLDLPLEMRREVYGHSLRADSGTRSLRQLTSHAEGPYNCCPSLLLVSWQISQEVLDWLLPRPVEIRLYDWEDDSGRKQLDLALHGALLRRARNVVFDVTYLPVRRNPPVTRQLLRLWKNACALQSVTFKHDSGVVDVRQWLTSGFPDTLPSQCKTVMLQELFAPLKRFWKKRNIVVRDANPVTNTTLEYEEELCLLYQACSLGYAEVVKELWNMTSRTQTSGTLSPVQRGIPAMVHAIRGGHRAVVKTLLDTGGLQIDFRDDIGGCALAHAVECGGVAMTRWLLHSQKLDPNTRDHDGMTPLHLAAAEGRIKTIRAILECSEVLVNTADNDGGTPLHWAVDARKRGAIRTLMDDARVDVNCRDSQGKTALIFAAMFGYLPEVKMLLQDPRTDADVIDGDGRTALSHASEQGQADIVRMLLAVSADPDSRDSIGRSPLLYAAALGRNSIMRMLLHTKRVEPRAKDSYGASAFHYVLQSRAPFSLLSLFAPEILGTVTQ